MMEAILRITTTPEKTAKKIYILSWYFPPDANIKINPQKGDMVAIIAARIAVMNTIFIYVCL